MLKDGEMVICSEVPHKYRFENNKRHQSLYTCTRVYYEDSKLLKS